MGEYTCGPVVDSRKPSASTLAIIIDLSYAVVLMIK